MEKIKTAGLVAVATMTLAMTGMFLGGPASADAVDEAFTELGGKVTTYGAATVGLVVAVVVLFFGIKFLKRGVAKA